MNFVQIPYQLIQEEISKLLLFESSSFRPGILTSLSEYVDRMQSDQKSIYYLFAPRWARDGKFDANQISRQI